MTEYRDTVALFEAILSGAIAFNMFAITLSYMFWQEDLIKQRKK